MSVLGRACRKLLRQPRNARAVSFALSDQAAEIQETTRKFTAEEIIPRAAHYDETGEYPWEVLRKAWDLGLMNTLIASEYGGLGKCRILTVNTDEPLVFNYLGSLVYFLVLSNCYNFKFVFYL